VKNYTNVFCLEKYAVQITKRKQAGKPSASKTRVSLQ